MYRNHEGYPDPTAGEALARIARRMRKGKKGLGYMPIVYICSPFAGDVERNLQNARRYCAYAVAQGALPIAPHLLFPQFLSKDETKETRELALHMGLILLAHCRELWYFGGRISSGMRQELRSARHHGIPVRHFTDDCREVTI